MISGTDFWYQLMKTDLTTKQFNNREYMTFNNLQCSMYHVLKKNAEEVPYKVGIVDTNNKHYTYLELLELTNKLSSYIEDKHGIVKGNHIGLLLYNSVEFVAAFLAAQKLGAVIVPLPTKYREPEVCSLIDKSDCDLLIVDEVFHSWVEKYEDINIVICHTRNKQDALAFDFLEQYSGEETKDNGSIEDVAVIMFTSGTTSFSKGVVIRNFNIQHAINTYQRILGVNEGDSTILALPIYNVTGLVATVSLFLRCQGTIHIHKFFNAFYLLTDIQQNNISFYHASPTIFTLMMEEKESFPTLPSLKKLVCGGANMPVKQIKELKEWLPNIEFRTVYGLSETSSPATIFPSDASESRNIGSSGKPIPGLSIKIVDDSDRELSFGETGEIWLKGTNVIEDYYNQQSNLITQDKWLKSGDIGYINQDGYLFVVDRKKDLINRGGEKIYSMDVENVIRQIDGVNEVTVVGVKHSVYGEAPVAIISLKEGFQINAESIQSILKTKLAKYEIPDAYYFVDEVLKTENGKIDKKRIREKLESQKECIQ